MKAYSPMLVLLGMLSAFFVVGCADQPIRSTETPLPTNTATLTARPTDTPVPTISPTNTQTPTPTLVPTPIPTLPVEQAEARLLELLANNGGCRLPCLWGFTPGKNDFKDLTITLSPFGVTDSPEGDFSITASGWSKNIGGVNFMLSKNNARVVGGFSYSGTEVFKLHAIGPKFETPDSFSPLLENFNYYLLPHILSNYGPPSEMIVGVFPFEPHRPNDWLPMNLGLFYPTQGFYIEYILTKQTKGEYFVGCPTQVVELSLVTWDPAKPQTLLDIAKLYPTFWGIGDNFFDEYYRPVSSALSMTPQQFYEKYKNPTQKACAMAPTSLWPYQ